MTGDLTVPASLDVAFREIGAVFFVWTEPLATAAGVIDRLAWGAALGYRAFVTPTVGDVTGTPARSFARWAADNVAAFGAQPSST